MLLTPGAPDRVDSELLVAGDPMAADALERDAGAVADCAELGPAVPDAELPQSASTAAESKAAHQHAAGPA